jgi:microcystin degradation protein MlrC
MRILIAGFQHETNTFAPSKANYENFVRGEGFPALVRQADVFGLREVNIPIGGFINAMQGGAHELVPVLWAGASPSAHVTEDAYERIAGEIIAAACESDIDAIYLDLHGAMVAEHVDDGEGELLSRLRNAVGPGVPIVATLDLHANVTARMLENADGLIAFRTYPHVDMAETGERAAAFLTALAGSGGKLHRIARRLPFLIPINAMCTMLQPALGAYERLAALEGDAVTSLSFAPGFPAADFPECGPVVWGYGTDKAAVEEAVDALFKHLVEREDEWTIKFYQPDDAVQEAQRIAATATRPVIIADTQDNPGAGGDSNTTGMLRALIRCKAKGAAVGLIYDPQAAALAHQAGVGNTVTLSLGGQSGVPGDEPLHGTFRVEHLSNGVCQFDGPMMNGMKVELGPVACLKIDDIRIAVSSMKAQMLDRNLFRVAGIQPEQMKILVNKSSVHFRADFQPIAEKILVAKAAGPMMADPVDLPWTRLAQGIRLSPGGPAFDGRDVVVDHR